MKKLTMITGALALLALSGCSNGRAFSMLDFANWSSEASGSRNSSLTFYAGAKKSINSDMSKASESVSVFAAASEIKKSTRDTSLTFYNAAQKVSDAQRDRKSTFFEASRAIGRAQGR